MSIEDLDKDKTCKVLKKLLAEMTGTGLLLCLGCGSLLPWYAQPSAFAAAIAIGMIVMVIIECFGHISGANLNPAVTVCSVLLNALSIPVSNYVKQFAL